MFFYWFQIFRNQCGSVLSTPVAVLGQAMRLYSLFFPLFFVCQTVIKKSAYLIFNMKRLRPFFFFLLLWFADGKLFVKQLLDGFSLQSTVYSSQTLYFMKSIAVVGEWTKPPLFSGAFCTGSCLFGSKLVSSQMNYIFISVNLNQKCGEM